MWLTLCYDDSSLCYDDTSICYDDTLSLYGIFLLYRLGIYSDFFSKGEEGVKKTFRGGGLFSSKCVHIKLNHIQFFSFFVLDFY